MNDAFLLRRFVDSRDEAAFAEIVQRHLPLVYASALRSVGHDAHLAQDAAQEVFVALARKAPRLLDRPTLGGWLYVAARRAAAEIVRRERRRKTREDIAMNTEATAASDSESLEWDRARPLLDEALVELKEPERDAIVLRFFEKRTFSEIAGVLHLSEEAARKRLDRALEKLRLKLRRRGLHAAGPTLLAALEGQAKVNVPIGLSAQIGQTAVAGLASAGLMTALLTSLWHLVVSPVGAFVMAALVGAGAVAGQLSSNRAAQNQLTALIAKNRRDLAVLERENLRIRRQAIDAETAQRRSALALTEGPHVRTREIASAANARERPSLSIGVSSRGVLSWEGEPITLSDFVQRLEALHRSGIKPAITLAAAGDTPLGALSYAMDQMRRAKFSDFALASVPDPAATNDWLTADSVSAGHAVAPAAANSASTAKVAEDGFFTNGKNSDDAKGAPPPSLPENEPKP